jgi:hypothetical protein
MKHFNCSTVLYSAETWGLQKINWKYMGSFEMWCWGMKISWSNHVRNEDDCRQSRRKETHHYNRMKKGQLDWLHPRNCLLKQVTKEITEKMTKKT